MWKTSFFIPTNIIFVILLLYSFRMKTLPVKAMLSLKWYIFLSLFAVILKWTVDVKDNHGDFAVYPACYTRIFITIASILFFLANVFLVSFVQDLASEVQKSFSVLHKGYRLFTIFCILIPLLQCGTDKVFNLSWGRIAFGPWHVIYAIHLVATMLVSLAGAWQIHHTSEIHAKGVFLAIFIQACGFILSLFQPKSDILSLFTALQILWLFLFYVEPYFLPDARSGFFTLWQWNYRMHEALTWPSRRMNRKLTLVSFEVINYNEKRAQFGDRQMLKGTELITMWVTNHLPNAYIYYLHNGRFAMIIHGEPDEGRIVSQIRNRFQMSWTDEHENVNLYLTAAFVTARLDNLPVRNEEDLNGLIFTGFQLAENSPDCTAVLNQDVFDTFSHQKQVHDRLIDALRHDGLEMFLQPIVCSATENMIGAEALVRLPDGHGGYYYPDEYIEFAEKNGLISDLGQQMFRKALQFLNRPDIRESSLQWICVNLSPIQFLDGDLVREYNQILREYDLPPSKIRLEITEEAFVIPEIFRKQMQALVHADFQLVLDDFGSRNSSILRLQRSNFVCVKIDKSLVWEDYKKEGGVLSATMQMLQYLHIPVTAEGIETKEMADRLRALGCTYFQGYLYSRPIPTEEFVHKYLQKPETGNESQWQGS